MKSHVCEGGVELRARPVQGHQHEGGDQHHLEPDVEIEDVPGEEGARDAHQQDVDQRVADGLGAEELSVAGVFFLSGSAPAPVRRALLGDLTVQVVVALATATARPYTPLAFGVLVPVFGLGMCGLWGATAGRFPPRGD